MSHDCNDHIIKDGKLVRDFEAMYQNFKDPWDQEANYENEYGPNLALCAIKILIKNISKPINKVLDIGCASGYHAPAFLDLPCKKYVGTDISETIINKANLSNKDSRVTFKSEDVLTSFSSLHENQYDLVFCAGTLYYVAPEIASGIVLNNIFKYCKKDGLFAYVYNSRVGQSFTDKWITLPEIRNKLADYFEEVFFCEVKLKDNEIVSIGILKRND
jgi:SAM-dependent methyltransferase